MQMLTHNITKSLIDTKTAQWINSRFINGASQKPSNYILENKSSFSLLKVVSELEFGHFYFWWPPLTSIISEVGWKTSNFIMNFDVGKKQRFWCIFKSKYQFWMTEAEFENWLHQLLSRRVPKLKIWGTWSKVAHCCCRGRLVICLNLGGHVPLLPLPPTLWHIPA